MNQQTNIGIINIYIFIRDKKIHSTYYKNKNKKN